MPALENTVTKFLMWCAAVLVVTGTVQAQVTIGPLVPAGAAGQTVDFDITYQGPTDTNGISFTLLYGPTQSAAFAPVFRGASTKIVCRTAPDLDPSISIAGVLLSPDKIAFAVLGFNFAEGPVAFGRTGVLGSCGFTIATTAAGTVLLPCDTSAGATTASDVEGDELTATCMDGTLTVTGPPLTSTPSPTPTPTPACGGDCNGDDSVSITEVVTGVEVALANLPVDACTNIDFNKDETVTIDDLIVAVNHALSGCVPGSAGVAHW